MKWLFFVSGSALMVLLAVPSITGCLLCAAMVLCLGHLVLKMQWENVFKDTKKRKVELPISIAVWGILAVAFIERWKDVRFSMIRSMVPPHVLVGNMDNMVYILAALSSVSILFIAVCINALMQIEINFNCVVKRTRICGGKASKLLVIIIISILSIIICMQSKTNIFVNGTSGTDSSVFRYIGWMMTKGLIPYKDIFDHKGLLTYFINYVGVLLSYDYGIWIIEVVFMFFTIAMSYRLARLFSNSKNSMLSIFIAFTMFDAYFEGGNFTEEWALPFILLALYIYMDYFIFDRISSVRVVVCGFSFACVCLLRPNMISVWIVFSLVFLIERIKKNEWSCLIKTIAYFLGGILAVGIPAAAYLCANDAMYDFIEDYLIFNFIYSGNLGWNEKIIAFIHFMCTPQLLAGICILILIIKGSKNYYKKINIWYFVLVFVTVAMASMSGYRYNHYGMVLIPLVIYPYSFFADTIEKMDIVKKNDRKVVGVAIKSGILICTIVCWLGMLINDIRLNNTYDDGIEQLSSYIMDTTDEDREIIVFGNCSFIYLKARRTAASKYFYQKPIALIDEKIKDKFIYELEMNLPEIVVFYGNLAEYEETFLNAYAYSYANTFDRYVVYRLPFVGEK